MTLSAKALKEYGDSMRISINPEQERIILERFGSEPDGYEWSEQDIAEQLRRICGER